jgi:hypothetical protein
VDTACDMNTAATGRETEAQATSSGASIAPGDKRSIELDDAHGRSGPFRILKYGGLAANRQSG